MTAEHPDRPGRARAPQAARHRPAPPGDRRAGYRDPQAGNGGGRPAERRRPVRNDDPAPARRLAASRADSAAPPPRLRRPDRVLRGLAGVLAGGMVVLALGVLATWFVADRYGLPGPGADLVIGHMVGAVVAVVGQRVADRRPDRTGTVAAAVVVGLVAFVLGFAWFL